MSALKLRNPLRRDPNRPTLKQRAAALKATAARLIRKPAVMSPDPAPEAVDWHSPPPGFMAFPAIEPMSFINIRIGIVAELERLRGIARAEYARREPLFRESFTQADLGARLSAIRDELRLSALDAAIADPKARRGGASADGPDPILAAIEASRTAQAAIEAWNAAIEARASPPTEADFADEDRLVEAQSGAQSHVIDTVPTTPAGRLALLEWLRWQMGLYSYTDGAPPDQGSHFWRFAYKSLAAALAWDGSAPVGQEEADAELIALGHAFDAATVQHREACDVLDAAEDRAEPRLPERPACLLLRVEDAPFCLRQLHCHPEALQGQPVTAADIEWMTRRPAQREVWVDDPRARPGWSMVPGKKPKIVHWPEAQARIDEIAAAWDAWHAEQDRVQDEAGVTDARAVADEASDTAAAIAQQAAALPARTLSGVWVKVRIAAFYGVADPTASPADGYTGEAALRSLYRDAPRLVLDATTADIRIVPEA